MRATIQVRRSELKRGVALLKEACLWPGKGNPLLGQGVAVVDLASLGLITIATTEQAGGRTLGYAKTHDTPSNRWSPRWELGGFPISGHVSPSVAVLPPSSPHTHTHPPPSPSPGNG